MVVWKDTTECAKSAMSVGETMKRKNDMASCVDGGLKKPKTEKRPPSRRNTERSRAQDSKIVVKIESSDDETMDTRTPVKTEACQAPVARVKKEEEEYEDEVVLPDTDPISKNLKTLDLILQHYKLTNELPQYTVTRKPKLKFRPPECTVMNLNNLNFGVSLEEQIEFEDLYFLHYALTYAKKTVVITGAGISVNSGIPDFRSSNGLFQGLASKTTGSGKNLFDYNVFRSTESIGKFETMIEKLYHLSTVSQPSPFHLMINDISKQGRLLRLYTQNIDCLDSELSHLKTEIPLSFDRNSNPKTVQLHGSVKLLNCSKCSHISELNSEYFENKRFGEGKLIRSCPNCEELNVIRQIAGKRTQNIGILRPRIVLYNEFHPDGEVIGTITEKDLRSKPDCLIITGTTLKIPGVRRLVKEMSKVVHANNGYVIWINIDEPSQSIIDYVDYFDLIIVGDCQLVPGLVKLYDYFTHHSGNKSLKPKTKNNKKVVKTEV